MESPGSMTLPEIRERIAPVRLAGQHQLPVPVALAELFPLGGLPTGWSVGVSGVGSWSLVAALAGALVEDHRWAAFVGAEEFGLVAASEVGLPLDRVLLVEHPEPQQWATVMAVLVEAVSVLCINPSHPIGQRDARRLIARAREQQTVLVHLDGGRAWPVPLDLSLWVEAGTWEGLGQGSGYLCSRKLTVEAQGRRSMAMARRRVVSLPDVDGHMLKAGC